MEIKTLATFVAPAVKMVVDYEDLQDDEFKKYYTREIEIEK